MLQVDYYHEEIREVNQATARWESWRYNKREIDALLGINIPYRTYYNNNNTKRRVCLYYQYTEEQRNALENPGFRVSEDALDYYISGE